LPHGFRTRIDSLNELIHKFAVHTLLVLARHERRGPWMNRRAGGGAADGGGAHRIQDGYSPNPLYTIGLNRPTTAGKRPVIWPSEQTSAASSKVGKQFSPRSTTVANLSSARLALSAFFFLNLTSRSTCSCCFFRGVRTSFTSGISSAPSR